MAYSYENELNALKNAQKQAAVADLQNTRNESLSNLEAERSQNASAYNSQRNTANVQNRLGAKNFQEYLASTGRANSGLASQARLQNQNNLTNNLNSINSAETATNADIARRITNANNSYNSGLASANANIEANYINNLLEQRQKAIQNDLAERQFNESVRQFNEQMALQKRQMYSSFNSGGSSGSKKSNTQISKSSNNTNNSGNQITKEPTSKDLNKLKWDGRSIGEITTKQGGKASVQLYDYNGSKYYKTSSGNWVKYR